MLSDKDVWGEQSTIAFKTPSDPKEIDASLFPPFKDQRKTENPFKKASIHYKVFCLSVPGEKQELEDLMTKSLSGKINIIREETYWDKHGHYLIAVKWMVIPESEEGSNA